VSVTVEPGGRASSGGSWSARDALGDALGVLEVAVGELVIPLAVLIPLIAAPDRRVHARTRRG
jgi:hypothetical protein